MKNKGLKILLIASLALNLAFFSGYGIKKFIKQTPVSPKELKAELDLNINQKQLLDNIINRFRLHMIQSKQNILEKRIEIIEELSDPEVDFELLETKTNELNKFENQMNHFFVNTLIEINNLLDEKQRLSFLLKLSQNWFFIKEPASGS